MFKRMDTENYLRYFGLCYILIAAGSRFLGIDVNGNIVIVISIVSFFLVLIEFENTHENDLFERGQRNNKKIDEIYSSKEYKWIQRRKEFFKLMFAFSLIVLPFSANALAVLEDQANNFALAAIGLSVILHGRNKEKSIYDYLDGLSSLHKKHSETYEEKARIIDEQSSLLKNQAELLKEQVDLMNEKADLHNKIIKKQAKKNNRKKKRN